ncbi:MAG: hypothetical protein K2W95_10695 [Candidatus Obscuribacterales bacterium]|nr:hypothetical protein [Candidatus Obscuribacterales bacterium]
MFDLRLAIGWFFLLNALTLVATGLLQPVATTVGTQTVNLNLCWGSVMGVFGLLMLLLAKLDSSKKVGPPQQESPGAQPPPSTPLT